MRSSSTFLQSIPTFIAGVQYFTIFERIPNTVGMVVARDFNGLNATIKVDNLTHGSAKTSMIICNPRDVLNHLTGWEHCPG